MVSGFSDYRSPVGMANENCRPVLRCKNSLGNCYVVLQRYRRILDDADAVAVSFQDLVDALPASAIHKATIDDNDVLHCAHPLLSMTRDTSAGLAWAHATGPRILARMCRSVTRDRCICQHNARILTSPIVGL